MARLNLHPDALSNGADKLMQIQGLHGEALFAFLSLNAMSATRYFRIPRDQVVELGSQGEI